MEETKYLLGILVERSTHTLHTVGRIEHRQRQIQDEVHEVKTRVSVLESIPTRTLNVDWPSLLIACCLLAAAAAGKVAWNDVLPSIFKLGGH